MFDVMTNENVPIDETDADVAQGLRPGVVLNNGQFKITKFLASGGFGITYLALDSLDRTVVVKECFPAALCRRQGNLVVPLSTTSQDQFMSVVRLFVREAKAMSKLVHPGIVGVHQIFEDNDTAYMALDLVDGCDLMDVIEQKAIDATPDRVVRWLRHVLDAVEFIHAHDVLHRDISPDNILIDADDMPILIDFGAAREHATKASRALTTLRVVKDGYSPQEFYVEGSAQNSSSDLYALGATFYHLITGEAPPNSQARLAALAEKRDDPYVPLRGRMKGYPDGFLVALDLALAVLPSARLQSAQAWIARVDAAGPALPPLTAEFDLESIRDEVKRITEEIDKPPAPVIVHEIAPQTPSEPPQSLLPPQEDPLGVDLELPIRRPLGAPRLATAILLVTAVVSGAIHAGGFLATERIAAMAILSLSGQPTGGGDKLE